MYDIESIIKTYLYPLIEEECKNLKVPKDFIKGIYGCHCKEFEVGRTEPIYENSKVIGVIIKIGDCNNVNSAIRTFFHEMYHVKEYFYGEKQSELKANLYEIRRTLKYFLKKYL